MLLAGHGQYPRSNSPADPGFPSGGQSGQKSRRQNRNAATESTTVQIPGTCPQPRLRTAQEPPAQPLSRSRPPRLRRIPEKRPRSASGAVDTWSPQVMPVVFALLLRGRLVAASSVAALSGRTTGAKHGGGARPGGDPASARPSHSHPRPIHEKLPNLAPVLYSPRGRQFPHAVWDWIFRDHGIVQDNARRFRFLFDA